MASIYRSTAKQTRGQERIFDGVEPTMLCSINSGVASRATSHYAFINQLFQSKTSILNHLPPLPTSRPLCLLFLITRLRQPLLKSLPHPIILYVSSKNDVELAPGLTQYSIRTTGPIVTVQCLNNPARGMSTKAIVQAFERPANTLATADILALKS
jgi:hypothetical protein